jgi:hypothetical protein
MMHEIGDIRANTQVPPLGLAPFQAAFVPEPPISPTHEHLNLQSSPVREHAFFQPSPHRYKSPFQDMPSPLPVEQLLLHKFINNLPTHSPSPFKTDIFVENPEQKRKLVERPVFLKERDQYDEMAVPVRCVEMAMVYDKPPKHRAHCVMVGSSKIDTDVPGQATVEFPCSVWTRKYPAGWDGIYLDEAGKLVNHEFNGRGRHLVWLYSAAACVVMQGVEKSIECVVPQKVVEFNGGQIDLEPAWEDVVNALKDECIRQVRGMSSFQQPQVPGQASWQQGFQQQVFSQQVLPPQMLMQLANSENHLLPKNSSRRRTQKTPKKSKKEQVPCPTQQAMPLQKFVSHAVERSASDVRTFTSGNNMKTPNSGNEYQTTVPQREGHFEQPRLGPPLGWVDGPILPSFGRPYQEGIGGPSAQGAVEAHGQGNNGPSQVVQPVSHGLQNNNNSPEQEDRSKPKRKRVPPNKKQPTQVVQEPSGQSDQVAEAETPPSGKAGTKRKNSISTRTPAKKTTAAKTGATKTPVTKTPTAKMPVTKTPSSKTPATKTSAKKRGRPPNKITPSSEVRDHGSATGEDSDTEDGMRGNVSEQQVQFGPLLPSDPATELETQQGMRDNGPKEPVQYGLPLPSDPSTGFETQQRRMSQSVQNHAFTANPTNQPQLSSSVWNNTQNSNPFDLHGSSAIDPHFQASQIYHQIRNIDAEQMRLFRTCPNAIVNPAGYLECQHHIGELGRMRDALSSVMSAHPFPMYPMAWNNGFQPNYGVYPTHQNDGQVHLNSQVFPAQQNDGFQYGPSQMSGMQQNNGSYQVHSQMSGPQWYNDFEPGNYLPPATPSFTQTGGFQQEAQAIVTLPDNSAMSNINLGGPGPNLNISQSTSPPTLQYPSPTQIALAEFPEDQVQRARSSVKSTLEKPFHGLSTNSSWAPQQEGDDRMTEDDLAF